MKDEARQKSAIVFDIRDLDLLDISLNKKDVWNYLVEDTPFSRRLVHCHFIFHLHKV